MASPRSHSTARAAEERGLLVVLALATVLAALVVAAQAVAAGGAQVKLGKTSLGSVLVDAKGRTLYMFTADKHGKSACYGQCATYWPPLLAGSAAVRGSGVEASLLGTTKRRDGKLQVTYHGRPLYRFASDVKAGQTNGEGINHFGGLWWAVSRSGAEVKKAAAPASTTTTSSGGGYGSGSSSGGGYGP